MNLVLQNVLGLLDALGGGGATVVGLSGWLGKVRADRLMQNERLKHDLELTELRSRLESQSAKALEGLRIQLDVSKAKHLSSFEKRIELYRMAGK